MAFLRNEAILGSGGAPGRTRLRSAVIVPLGREAVGYVTSLSMDHGSFRPGVRPGGDQGGVPALGGGGVADLVHSGSDPGDGRGRPGPDGGACRVGFAVGD